MKMKVGRLNISLSVEDTILTERTREESTCYLLNYLSMIFAEAAKLEKYNPDRTPENAAALSVIYDRYANEIYQHLKKNGFYDDLYEEKKNEND